MTDDYIVERLLDAFAILHQTPAQFGQDCLDRYDRSSAKGEHLFVGSRDELSADIKRIAFLVKEHGLLERKHT
jgi:hypothetical protein